MLLFAGLLLFAALNLWTLKQVKFQRIRVFKFPGLSEWIASALIATYLAMGSTHTSPLATMLYYLPAYVLLVILYIDAVVFQVYSAEIEPSSIRLFFNNFGIMKSDESTYAYIVKEKNIIYPVFAGLFYCTMLIPQIAPYTASLYAAATFMVVSKSRIKVITFLLIALACFLLIKMAHTLLLGSGLHVQSFSLYLAGTAVAVLSFMEWLRFANRHRFQHPFWTQNTALFGITGLYTEKIDTSKPISDHDRQVFGITTIAEPPSPSTEHGKFKDCNIVLISLESVGKSALDFYEPGGARTPTFNALSKNAYIPKNHSCISPNTRNSLFTMHNGDYNNNVTYPYVKALNAEGYESFFLTPQNLFKATRAVLTESDYTHIYATEELAPLLDCKTDGWGAEDSIIYDIGIKKFMEERKKEAPFFLHILSNQTHINYKVYDTETFNHFPNHTPEGRYKNGIEESDFLIGEVLKRLKKANLMENTLVVFTGDHGEAFGKLDYRSHSNAIIGTELNVPFLIHHPGIEGTNWLGDSNHFDLFPTLLDLAGIENTHTGAGDSIFSESHANDFIAYSYTRKGNLPSNFGSVVNGKKIMVDLILGRYWTLDHDDNITSTLNPNEKKIALTVLHDELKKRGLIY